jgi:hypothetical protein
MYLLGLKYLEALPKLAEGEGSTIFLPAEATGVMGAIGGLKELLVKAGSPVAGASRPGPAYQAPTRGATARVLADADKSGE